jgi:hypothetical protein
MEILLQHYPSDSAGSPFGTGKNTELAPVYKQMAAIQGDMIFQTPRRMFMKAALKAGNKNIWGFRKLLSRIPRLKLLISFIQVSTRFKHGPWVPLPKYRILHYLGAVCSYISVLVTYADVEYRLQFHGTDLSNAYNTRSGVLGQGGQLLDYIICFANTGAPNNCGGKTEGKGWPAYQSGSAPSLLSFGVEDSVSNTTDDYRSDAMDFIAKLIPYNLHGRAPDLARSFDLNSTTGLYL